MRTGEYLQRLLRHDLVTFEHCIRVARNLRSVAKLLDLDLNTANQLVIAGLLHDIGKLEVSSEVLTNPSGLSNLEKGEIYRHPKIGREIAILLGKAKLVQELVVSHHEPGYPRVQTRVPEGFFELKQYLRLADQLDALKSRRSYKPEFSDLTCKEILLDGGFREDLVTLFLTNYS